MSHTIKKTIIAKFIRESFMEITLPQSNLSIEEVGPIDIGITTENGNGNENDEKIEENFSNEGDLIIEEAPVRRSIRTTQHSTRLRDFITYKVQYPI